MKGKKTNVLSNDMERIGINFVRVENKGKSLKPDIITSDEGAPSHRLIPARDNLICIIEWLKLG